MEKQIAIKSDYESLSLVHKEMVKNFILSKSEESKSIIKTLILLFVFVISSVWVSTIYHDIILIAFALVIGFVLLLSIWIYKRIKVSFAIKRTNEWFVEFTSRYKGISFVHYNLFEDKVEYDGECRTVYFWSEFLCFIDYRDMFWLMMEDSSKTIWIPQMVMVNPDDFEYFKEFAKKRIKENYTLQSYPDLK